MDTNINSENVRLLSKNPAIIPNVVQTIKKCSKGALEELYCLRQLSQLYYKTFASTYFDELNKSLTIEPKVDDNADNHRTSLDELSYIYRRIVVKKHRIYDFDFPNSILPYIRSIELCPYEKMLDENNERTFQGEAESIKLAVQLCQKFLSKLTNLKILDIKYAESGGELFERKLLSSLPQNIHINLHIQRVDRFYFIYNFIQEFELSPPTNLSLRIGTLHFDTDAFPDSFRLGNTSLQMWIDMTKSRIDAIFIHSHAIKYEVETLYDIMTMWKSTTLIFQKSGLTYPCTLSHTCMTQQISKLHLQEYLRPLAYIKDMPQLKILILEHIDIYAFLFSDIELTYKENLRILFDGLKHLEVKLIRSSDKPGYDKITPGNHVAEYIGTLVRKFQVI